MNEYKYTEPNNFSEFENITPIYRRTLLPWYIRFFSWVFMIGGGIAIISVIPFIVIGWSADVDIFGLNVLPAPYSTLLSSVFWGLGGAVGYLLWTERKNALKAGQIFAIAAIVISIITTIMSLTTGFFMFRLEIIFLVLFWRKLNAMEYDWEVTGVSRTGQD